MHNGNLLRQYLPAISLATAVGIGAMACGQSSPETYKEPPLTAVKLISYDTSAITLKNTGAVATIFNQRNKEKISTLKRDEVFEVRCSYSLDPAEVLVVTEGHSGGEVGTVMVSNRVFSDHILPATFFDQHKQQNNCGTPAE